MKIIPIIQTNSQADLDKKIRFLESKSEWVQIDVVDGKFVNNQTFPLEWLNQYQDKGFSWDIHLMVNNPFSWVEKCNFVMAQRVVGQIEEMGDQLDFIDRVESEGMEPGLAIDLPTRLDNLEDEALFRSSVVILLAAKAGFSGQNFNKAVLSKLTSLQEKRKSLQARFLIGMDCGIKEETLPILIENGLDIAYINSGIWTAHDWSAAFSRLKEKETDETTSS